METQEAIRRVRVVRDYAPEPLGLDVLTAIVDAGRHAGSSRNQQRWAFVVVRDRATLARLAAVGPYAGHVAGAAAAIALLTPSASRPMSVMWDLGRAAQNMVLVAWDLGIGSCPITVYEQPLVHEILGLPEDRHCEYLLSLGRPADAADLARPPRKGGRKPLDEVMRLERWG